MLNGLADAAAYFRMRADPSAPGALPWRSAERPDGAELGGYPGNHALIDRGASLIPGFQLFRRWRRLSALYPPGPSSLLDIGCSRGYFVLEAAARQGCARAVGLDLDPGFIATGQALKRALGLEAARFVRGRFFELPAELTGEDFELLLVINCYHYLFWGELPTGVERRGHRWILDVLAGLGREVLFSNPLELGDCPRGIRAHGAEPGAELYTAAAFREAAAERFVIEEAGRFGKRALVRLRRRES